MEATQAEESMEEEYDLVNGLSDAGGYCCE